MLLKGSFFGITMRIIFYLPFHLGPIDALKPFPNFLYFEVLNRNLIKVQPGCKYSAALICI